MPIYEYQCKKCTLIWEAIRPIAMKNEPLKCPCGGETEVLISVPASPDFRGEGWTPIHHPGPQD